MELNTSAFLLSSVGFLSSIFTFILNTVLIYKLKPWKKLNRKNEYVPFYYRFLIDIFHGFTASTYLGSVIGFSTNFSVSKTIKDTFFYSSLATSNLGAARSLINLIIAMERCFAAWAPIIYHNIDRHFPTILIFLSAVIFGLFEDVVLYLFCDFELNLPSKCIAFGCATNSCFYNYWSAHKTSIFALNVLFSLLLCLKIFVIRNCDAQGNKAANLNRVNRLSLIDAFCVFVFNFLPSFIAREFPTFFSFETIGPYGVVSKMFGCAIESLIFYRTLLRKREPAEKTGSNTFMKRRIIGF